MLIEVENLEHVYLPGTPYETVALKDISFALQRGSFTAVIGETGSGKSTLVQHLNGLLKPTSGKVLLEGKDIGAKNTVLKDVRKKIGLLFQSPEEQLFADTVFEDVAFGLKNLGVSPDEVEEKVAKAVAVVGLDFQKMRKMSPFKLSGGEKRRVALAGILAMEPDVLILDEPTSGLDPLGRQEILAEIDYLRQVERKTIVVVSHNLEETAARADQLLVLSKGELILKGSPAGVFEEEEKLEAAGLAVPELSRIVRALKKRGFSIRTDIFTVDEAEAAIVKALRKDKV